MNALQARALEQAAARFTDVELTVTPVHDADTPTELLGFTGYIKPPHGRSIIWSDREWAATMLYLANRIIRIHEARWGAGDPAAILHTYGWPTLLSIQQT